jgi:hypothetical protein
MHAVLVLAKKELAQMKSMLEDIRQVFSLKPFPGCQMPLHTLSLSSTCQHLQHGQL